MIKEFLLSFSSVCHRQSQMGHETIAQNVLDIPGSDSNKTLSRLSSSLHLENAAFPETSLPSPPWDEGSGFNGVFITGL